MTTKPRSRWLALALGAALLLPAGVALAGAAHHVAGGWHHPAPPQSADDIRDHMQRMEDRALEKVGATDAQRDQIDGILDEAAQQAWDHHQRAEELRHDFRDALLAPKVDRGKLEGLRQQAIDLADDGSKQLVGTLADIADVLTPEQRADLGDLLDQLHDEGPPPGGPGFGPGPGPGFGPGPGGSGSGEE